MRRIVSLAVALAFLAAGAARAEEKKDSPKAVLDRGITAAGGEARLAKYTGHSFKAKGKFYGMGEGMDYTGEWHIQSPDKVRMQIDGEAGGMKFTFIRVVNGDKIWVKFGNDVQQVDDKDQIAETREELHANRVTSLLPLVRDKGYELAPLGEIQVDGKPAVGVKVSSKGRRDVDLYFDKGSGLLVRRARTVKDPMAGDKEQREETTYGAFKDIDGIKHPMKVVVTRDGKKYVEGETTELIHQEKIDDAVFTKP